MDDCHVTIIFQSILLAHRFPFLTMRSMHGIVKVRHGGFHLIAPVPRRGLNGNAVRMPFRHPNPRLSLQL